jgi:hypothetical protein
MAKRFLPLAAVALVTCVLAACSNPTAPAATPAHHVVPQSSAGVLIGGDA